MRIALVATLVLLALSLRPAASVGAEGQAQADDTKWLDFPSDQFEVSGLPWFDETKPSVRRLPERFKGQVRDGVWQGSACPAGGRIRLASDTRRLYLKVKYDEVGGTRNFSNIGRTGFDLFVDGVGWRGAWTDKPGEVVLKFFNGADRKRRELTVYMPTYDWVTILAVGVDRDAQFWKPSRFAVEKPIVYYGTSITQGGCASRAGMAYPAIVSRLLNVDHVNLGFSGEGKGYASAAKMVADVDASCFVMDWSQNNIEVSELEQELPAVPGDAPRHASGYADRLHNSDLRRVGGLQQWRAQ